MLQYLLKQLGRSSRRRGCPAHSCSCYCQRDPDAKRQRDLRQGLQGD